MKAKLFVRAIALIALVTTLLIGSTMLASTPLISVELCVDLQGQRTIGLSDEPIVYDLVDASGTAVVSGEVSSAVIIDDNTGCFTVPSVQSGVYDVVFLSSALETDHLTNVVAGVNFATNGETITLMEGGANAVLLEGDADSDNSVTLADLSIHTSSYDPRPPLYRCVGDADYDARADFDEDDCVTLADRSMHTSNYDPRPPFYIMGDTYP